MGYPMEHSGLTVSKGSTLLDTRSTIWPYVGDYIISEKLKSTCCAYGSNKIPLGKFMISINFMIDTSLFYRII